MTVPTGTGTLNFPEAIPILPPNDEQGALVSHPRTTADCVLAGAAFRKLALASPDDQRRRLVPRRRHTPGMIAALSKHVQT